MNIKIKPKISTDFLGRNQFTIISVNMNIEYKVGSNNALGYYELLDNFNNIIYSGNEQISTIGWGEDDTIIYDNFLDVLNLERFIEDVEIVE
jgi:hypothetical protein